LVRAQLVGNNQVARTVADPSLYTLSFGLDDRAAVRLNCSRGTGTWSATPADDVHPGSLAISPLVSTRALRPQPSLDEKLARGLVLVRSDLQSDGQSHRSLVAEGDIYSWAPFALSVPG
jgi:hypothetical protein